MTPSSVVCHWLENFQYCVSSIWHHPLSRFYTHCADLKYSIHCCPFKYSIHCCPFKYSIHCCPFKYSIHCKLSIPCSYPVLYSSDTVRWFLVRSWLAWYRPVTIHWVYTIILSCVLYLTLSSLKQLCFLLSRIASTWIMPCCVHVKTRIHNTE